MTSASAVSLAFLSSKPKAAAELLREFTPELTADFFASVPLDHLIPVIREMASWPAARALALLPQSLAATILQGLPAAQAETTLRLIAEEQRLEILEQMPERLRKSFSGKLTYPVTTVGAWMDANVPFFPQDNTVAECLHFVKNEKRALSGVIIVVDYSRHLQGIVELEKLLTSDGACLLADLLGEVVEPLPSRATLWEVEDNEGWIRYPTLPVIDRENILLGVLTHSALQAGTAKSQQLLDPDQRISLIPHMWHAFFVAISGLAKVVLGTPTNINSHGNER